MSDWGPPPRLRLPGSGSDYTVFLHHLGIPVLDIGFGGNSGGHYHTVFDDFEMMDRYLDPTWQGHETAGLAVAEILNGHTSVAGRRYPAGYGNGPGLWAYQCRRGCRYRDVHILFQRLSTGSRYP